MKMKNVFIRIAGALIALLVIVGAVTPLKSSLLMEDTSAKSDLSILDSNGDGVINPYEALDALLFYRAEGDDLTIDSLVKLASKANIEAEERHEEDLEELNSMFVSLDKNGDGMATWDELESNEEIRGMGPHLDTNGDKSLSFDEFGGIFSLEEEFETPEQMAEYIEELFTEMDTNKDGSIDIKREVEVEDGRDKSEYLEMDLDRDGMLTRDEALLFNQKSNRIADFRVEGDVAYMNGLISSEFPATVLELLFEQPEVKKIVMEVAPGSMDDVANIRASFYVNKHGLTTEVKSNAMIASGGTDFFMAGTKRIVAKGALLGVHSWGGSEDVPRDHPEHQKYLDFYEAVDVHKDFYWYTMDMAPPEGIHWMTEEEINFYRVRK